jgi:hypothetical protein
MEGPEGRKAGGLSGTDEREGNENLGILRKDFLT